jgi:hypothetical protein
VVFSWQTWQTGLRAQFRGRILVRGIKLATKSVDDAQEADRADYTIEQIPLADSSATRSCCGARHSLRIDLRTGVSQSFVQSDRLPDFERVGKPVPEALAIWRDWVTGFDPHLSFAKISSAPKITCTSASRTFEHKPRTEQRNPSGARIRRPMRGSFWGEETYQPFKSLLAREQPQAGLRVDFHVLSPPFDL